MINNGLVLGLVVARGGSKGLPGKNIRPLCGKPLIGWTIEAGRKSQFIDDLIVSTDCENIAKVALEFSAEVPFMRPSELAEDTTNSFDVIKHALDWLNTHGRRYEYLVLLEPTSPLRESKDIDCALEEMIAKKASSIVGTCLAETTHPFFMYKQNDNDRLIPFVSGLDKVFRRQDLESVFFLEGTVYASKIDVLLEKKGFYHEDTIGYEVPKWKSPEIDDEVDFLLVESIMKSRGIAQ